MASEHPKNRDDDGNDDAGNVADADGGHKDGTGICYLGLLSVPAYSHGPQPESVTT